MDLGTIHSEEPLDALGNIDEDDFDDSIGSLKYHPEASDRSSSFLRGEVSESSYMERDDSESVFA